MRIFLLLSFFCAHFLMLQGQPVTVRYNDERNYFNEGQPLPVEKQMLFTGNVMEAVEAVEISFSNPKGKEGRAPLYSAVWKKPAYKKASTFELPINYKLRSSSEYDVQIKYYRAITATENAELKERLFENLDAIIDLELKMINRKSKPTEKQIVRTLDQSVEDGLVYFINLSNIKFQGFSDVVRHKIESILSQKQFRQKTDTAHLMRNVALDELKQLTHRELEQILNSRWGVLTDSRLMDDYPTEKTLNIIAVNGGYGGIILPGLDSLSFGGSPYVGVSFPLGKKAMASPFWSNTSINVGVFLNNFTDDSGAELTGPIFNRPYYVGMGYKAFKFIRVNAGATLLEDVDTAGLNLSGLGDRVSVRPFIGISAEINLWANFAQ